MKLNLFLNRKEILLGMVLSFFFASLAFLPVVYGVDQTPPEMIFLGTGGTDEFSHLAWISQAAAGKWLFRSPYYLGNLAPIFFHPFYLFIGLIVKITGFPAPFIFSLARLPLSFFFFLTIFISIAYFIGDKTLRIPAFLLTSLGGGLVWLDFQNPDPDWMETLFSRAHHHVEANSFFIAKQDQATVLATSLLIWSFLFFVQALASEKRRSLLLAGISASLLFLIHPFMVIPVFLTLLTFLLILNWLKKRPLFSLSPKHLNLFFIFTLICLPPIGYYLFLVLGDSWFRSWSFEWKPPPLVPLDLIFFFGFLLFPLPFGARQLLKEPSPQNIFLLVWPGIALTTACFYPYNFGTRMMEGVHLPLSLIAVLGMKTLLTRPKANFFRLWPIFLISVLPSTGYLLSRDLNLLNRHLPDYYASKDLLRVIARLKNYCLDEDTILASFYNAYVISALTGQRVFAGVQAYCPSPRDSCFPVILNRSLSQKEEVIFLKNLHIHYLVIDKTSPPRGRKGQGWEKVYTDEEAQKKDYFSKVYENPSLVLYQLKS